jgi:hypothetical protein
MHTLYIKKYTSLHMMRVIDEQQLGIKRGWREKLLVGGTTSGRLDHLWPHAGA